MVTKLLPELNKIYFIEKYTMIHILEGKGGIQVDFRVYHNWADKIIFLDKGQHIKFLSSAFVVRKIEFPDEALFRNKEVRVLFKHLISLGYIEFQTCLACQQFLSQTLFSNQIADIIDISTEQWYWQNPFQVNREEYHLIFDVKDMIDRQFQNHLTNEQLSSLICDQGYQAHTLYKDKVGISIRRLLGEKRLLEGKKEIAFSNKTIKEIAYELGYKDPAYFNRVFKQKTGISPNQFREEMAFIIRDQFISDLYELLDTYHTS